MRVFTTVQIIPSGKGAVRQVNLYRWQLRLIALLVSLTIVVVALAAYYGTTVLMSAAESERLREENSFLKSENENYRQALSILDSVQAEQERLLAVGATLLGPADSVPELAAAAERPESRSADEALEEHVRRYRKSDKAAGEARPSIKPVIGVVTQRWKEGGSDHQGVDIAALLNDPVYAASSGTVVEAGDRKDLGLTVVLDHGEGWKTLYAHLNRILVAKGDLVHRGSSIGTIGMTGNTTGPHLHYEVLKNDKRQDPSLFFMD